MISQLKKQLDQLQYEKSIADPATFLYAYLAGRIEQLINIIKLLQSQQ